MNKFVISRARNHSAWFLLQEHGSWRHPLFGHIKTHYISCRLISVEKPWVYTSGFNIRLLSRWRSLYYKCCIVSLQSCLCEAPLAVQHQGTACFSVYNTISPDWTCHWWLMGGPWVVNDPSAPWGELHLSPSHSLLQPLKRLAAVFTADPGVRWKTYTHKQHLLFMPSARWSTHSARWLWQLSGHSTDRQDRPNDNIYIWVNLWPL